jgi:RNA polymerase sigma-70 factor (ECF subfamily)
MGPQVPLEIIEAARGGQAADIERLLEAVWADAYRLSRAIVSHAQCAEDAAQESCVIMFCSIAGLRHSRAFRTWFYRIVLREARKQKKLLSASIGIPPDFGYCEDPSASIDLRRALAVLTDKHRTAIVLHYFENLSTREIATILRIPEATVRFRLMTARHKLRPLLQENAPTSNAKGEKLHGF